MVAAAVTGCLEYLRCNAFTVMGPNFWPYERDSTNLSTFPGPAIRAMTSTAGS